MLRHTLGMMRELPRLQEIAAVFIRHGLGEFVQRIGIAGVLERAGQILHRNPVAESVALEPAQRMRMALEELGPTFVKLGQVMATRVDLFPPSWIVEFEKLQAQVPAVPFEALLPDLTRSLGRSPFEVFRDVDTRAYGAASIAQVHRAKLQDGTPVVLKVRRPGVREKIDADLRLLRRVSELIESEMPEARRYRPAEVAAQFARTLEREADFVTETRNIERFAKNFAGNPNVVIPRIYPEYTSEVLLVQEWVDGIPATDLAAVERASLDKKLLAARGVDAFLKMILIDGFFHADPHPGNVFYLPDHRMVIIDYIRVGHAIRQFAAIVREHSIVLPSDLSLMFKTLITLEGLGRQYDPDFHITDHLTPLVRSALGERYKPNELIRRGRSALNEFMSVVGGVPKDLARFLREARRGKTRIDLDLKRLDSFGRQLDRTLDRVTVGIMTASLVIGSAIVLTVQDGPIFLGVPVLPALGLFGYLLAFFNSLWIVYGIWRSGRE
jgi:ubiquinone biosynthesis protein